MSVLKNIDLAKKIVLSLLFAGLVSVVLVGSISYFVGVKRNSEIYAKDTKAALHARWTQIQRFQASVIGDLDFLSEMRDTAPMFKVLTSATEASNEKAGEGSVKNAYVDGSPHPVGEREFLDDAGDGSKYSAMHKRIHPTMRQYLYSRGYYDIFLINTDGDIVYSVYKEADFQTNLMNGEYADSGLGDAFREAMELEAGEYAFSDLQPYAPSAGAYAGFAAMPVYASPGFGAPEELAGIVAVQLPLDLINGAILADEESDPIQSYLVGADGFARTDVPATEAVDIGVASLDLSKAPDSGDGMFEGAGLLSTDSVIGVSAFTFLGEPWFVVLEQTRANLNRSLVEMRNSLLMSTVPVLLLIGLIAWMIGRGLARPVIEVGNAMATMTGGNLNVEIPGIDRGDEIGAMARNTDEFRQKLADADEADARQAEKDAENEAERVAMLADLEQSVGSIVKAVSAGKFDERVDAEFKDEAFRNLGSGVNGICDVVQNFVSEIEETISRLADGDLTAEMTGQYEGRFAEVKDSINETAIRLGTAVAGIKQTGEEMNHSIKQVAEGSSDLARRAESQAASLEETAATMDKMTRTIDLNAKSARKAEDLASDTRDQAVKGHAVVEDAVTAMGGIEESSTKITDIISVIDSIAFQTNLLALNAAVEAARAGDAGKGFAVVASEVRTLAQRSSEAAKDITDLINVSSEKVKDGVQLVNATGVALNDITTAVTAFSETISDISKASQEQSLGVAEISGSVSHMDEMTQHNATLADSSASAAQSLSQYADKLSEMIQAFKTSSIHEQNSKGPAANGAIPKPAGTTADGSAQPLPSIEEALMASEATADQEWVDVAASASTGRGEGHSHAVGEDWSDF